MAKLTTSYKGDMLFETKIGKHTVTLDVPDSMGGSDRAPTPPQVFVSSLGGCICAFIANYCNAAKLDTTDLTVDVEFEKIPNPTRLTDIKITVNLPNADVKGREKALLKVAEHCPVHETMEFFDGLDLTIKDRNELAKVA